MISPAWLECGHCGDVAIYSDANGMFTDGDGNACVHCGFPGQVMVDDAGCEEDNTAYWSMADDGVCNSPDCEECVEFKEAEK